jgi:LmbE family N-acetylglucosaminyl deacetylase
MIGRNAPGRVVALSPHFDDALLSVGGLLAAADAPVTVVTVHGGAPPGGAASEWDRLCGFATGAEAARARALEDRRACGVIGAEPVHLAYPDGIYGAPPSLDALTEAIEGLVTEDALVLVPAAVCRHADHHRVRDAALAALARLDADVWLYADQPYAGRSRHWGGPGAETLADDVWRDRMTPAVTRYGLAEARTVRLTVRDWAVKHRAVLAYASQLVPLATYAGHFLAFQGPLSTELVWRVGLRPGAAGPAREEAEAR